MTAPPLAVPSDARDSSTGLSGNSGLTPLRSRRRPWLVGLGALLTTLGALAVVWLVGAAGQRQDVLAVRAEVAYGQMLTNEDVAVVRVSADPGVAVLSATRRGEVTGQVATTRLVPGMLLTAEMLAAGGDPPPGRVLVPIALPEDRMPAGGLHAGDRLLLVDTESVQAAATPAEVVRVGPVDLDGVAVVDVTTSPRLGPGLAVSSARGHVAVVVEPAGG